MHHEYAEVVGRADAGQKVARWNVCCERFGNNQRTEALLAASQSLPSNPQLVTCASPAVSRWFGLEKGLNSLKRFRNLRKLVFPSSYQQNLLPVLRTLRSFTRLEDLELRSIDISRPKWPAMFPSDEDAAKPFCDFSKLKRLVLIDVKVDERFFAWLAEAANLECLKLKDMNYEGDLHCLKKLTSLRHLELTGCCNHFCSVLRCVSYFQRLEDLSIEIGAPDEDDLRLLSKCSAHVHLKARRCYHPGQINALCEIHKLKSLTLSSPFGFKIPSKFKDLKRLTSLGFIDEGDAFNKIEGFENVPTSVRSLSLDLNCPKESRLTRMLSRLTTQLTSLSSTQKYMHKVLGLGQFDKLESLELRGKRDLCPEVLHEIKGMANLKHLAIGGCLGIQRCFSVVARHMDLESLSIENGVITTDGVRMSLLFRRVNYITTVSHLPYI